MDTLLYFIPKSINNLMTVRAQNNVLLVHKQQDPRNYDFFLWVFYGKGVSYNRKSYACKIIIKYGIFIFHVLKIFLGKTLKVKF